MLQQGISNTKQTLSHLGTLHAILIFRAQPVLYQACEGRRQATDQCYTLVYDELLACMHTHTHTYVCTHHVCADNTHIHHMACTYATTTHTCAYVCVCVRVVGTESNRVNGVNSDSRLIQSSVLLSQLLQKLVLWFCVSDYKLTATMGKTAQKQAGNCQCDQTMLKTNFYNSQNYLCALQDVHCQPFPNRTRQQEVATSPNIELDGCERKEVFRWGQLENEWIQGSDKFYLRLSEGRSYIC